MPESSRPPTGGAKIRPLTAPEGAADADQLRPPSLAELWDAGLLDRALDPEKPLFQLGAIGLGPQLDRLLGGGLQPGNMAGFVSAGAGIGKTAFLHQLADGLAEQSAATLAGGEEAPSVTPVLFVTEMRAEDLTLRSLARQSEQPGFLLRAPGGFEGSRQLPEGGTVGEDALERARAAAATFGDAARFLYVLDRRATFGNAGPIADLQQRARAIREYWEGQGCAVPAVVLIVDPIHRLLETRAADETGAIADTLRELLDVTHAPGEELVTLFSSDTTKGAAAGRGGDAEKREEATEQAFRGSYQFLHVPDFALGLWTLDPFKSADGIPGPYFDRPGMPAGWQLNTSSGQRDAHPWRTVFAEVVTSKTRWSEVGTRPAYWLDRALFRFVPLEGA